MISTLSIRTLVPTPDTLPSLWQHHRIPVFQQQHLLQQQSKKHKEKQKQQQQQQLARDRSSSGDRLSYSDKGPIYTDDDDEEAELRRKG